MSDALHARHAAHRPRALRVALPIGLIVTMLGALWSLTEVPAAAEFLSPEPPVPAVAAQLPRVEMAEVAAADPCAESAVQAALDSGDDEAVVAAFGGGEAFREAVAVGGAPCISLNDPTRHWVVVNKQTPLAPVDYEPTGMTEAPIPMTTASRLIRGDAASALGEMADALSRSGAGALGMNNAYRSYRLQARNYSGFVSASGQAAADRSSARPGYSEHQTGLAVDVVACSAGCGEIGAFGGTAESDWVAQHAWEYGFIVRYEEGESDTTGYVPEPWHLRYIGSSLAAAYHEGGFHTLEEFFGLPAAPDYVH